MLSDIADAAALPRTELLLALATALEDDDSVLTLGLRPIDAPAEASWGLEGARDGRRVRVDVGGGLAVTTVGVPGTDFRLHAYGGRLHPDQTPAPRLAMVLDALSASPRWTDLEAVGGADGVLIARRSQTGDSWPYDLWLAERLIGAMRRPGAHRGPALAAAGPA